jgi:iron complex transport system substrate-binding protein
MLNKLLPLNKHCRTLLLVLLTSFFLSGCNLPAKPAPNAEENTGNTAAFDYPFNITDFLDREVTIAKQPQRIVSLSPATTEILFALGIGDRLVGVTSYDDYPPEKIRDLPKVGDFQGPNIEAILAQQPDLIFASRLSGKDQMDALHDAGFTVVVLEAASFQQVFDSIRLTARITNTTTTGDQLISAMQKEINEVQEKVQDLPPVKTFYLVDANGTWTAGKNTFIDELISIAGGENIAGDVTGWVQYSLEAILEKNPAVILTAPHAGKIAEIKQTTGFKETKAVKNNRVYTISDDNIISRPSDRIVQGLKEIATLLHPTAF